MLITAVNTQEATCGPRLRGRFNRSECWKPHETKHTYRRPSDTTFIRTGCSWVMVCPRTGWRPSVFHNLPHPSDGDPMAFEAGMRTSAVPCYFPIYQGAWRGVLGRLVPEPSEWGVRHNAELYSAGYCDGGVLSKDPSLVALCKAKVRCTKPWFVQLEEQRCLK